jgi:integrase-like protein
VFPGRNGGPLDSSTVFRAVRNAGKRAGVPWVGPHTLRHTCGTRLFRAGLNSKQVQLWLGHHSPAFTLATYVHLLPEDLPEPVFFDKLSVLGENCEEDAARRGAYARPWRSQSRRSAAGASWA